MLKVREFTTSTLLGVFFLKEYPQNLLESEWKKRNVLPLPRLSPPPSSAQKVHGTVENHADGPSTKKEPRSTPAPLTPAQRNVGLPTPAVARTATPAQIPVASTSKQTPLRPRSSRRHMTPDVEVDVVSPDDDGDGQEEGGVSFHPERDPLSEEIVKQLEKGLPRWPGLGEYGWMQEVKPVRLFLI